MRNCAFFGTSALSVHVLNELLRAGYTPALIVSTPDLPQGKKQEIVVSPVATWAAAQHIPLLQPEKLSDPVFLATLSSTAWDVFIVASYGKIIPKQVLELPRRGTLNVHPSLLPLLRGPSPIQSAILNDMRDTGVTIMAIDAHVDHGPIVAQKKAAIAPADWPLSAPALQDMLGHMGGELLATVLPGWIAQTTPAQEQQHSAATHTALITKQDGELKETDTPYARWLKYNALQPWPGVYYMHPTAHGPERVLITEATYTAATHEFVITRVTPAGRKEMSYADYVRGLKGVM